MTEELFRNDGYLKSCESQVTAVEADMVCLDQTIFYHDRGSGYLLTGCRYHCGIGNGIGAGHL